MSDFRRKNPTYHIKSSMEKKQAQIVKDEVRARVAVLKDLGWQPL